MKTLFKQFNLIVLFALIFLFQFCLTLTSCTEEEIDCLQEQNKIEKYYNDLIEDATGNIEEQERLMALKAKELEDYDCLWRWKTQ